MRSTLTKIVIALTIMAFAGMAQAQATRTWVSGVGDDANPCSRTAPCKTFAGAISKTATNGEINALDDGGFGTVTITKPITIDGGSHIAGVLNAGVNGIVINTAGASDVVILRNLDINGANTGLDGIKILATKRVIVENCKIYAQNSAAPNGNGIHLTNSTGTIILSVRHCQIDRNSGRGIHSTPTGAGGAAIDVSDTTIEDNGASGIQLVLNSKAAVSHSYINLNGGSGISVDAASDDADVASSFVNFNSIGFTATAGSIRLFNTQVTHNGQSIVTASGGQVQTHGNNAVLNNSIQVLPAPNVGLQ